MLARQALYHLSFTPNHFYFSLFFRYGLTFAQGQPKTMFLLPLPAA
jgi:hypothetical protein